MEQVGATCGQGAACIGCDVCCEGEAQRARAIGQARAGAAVPTAYSVVRRRRLACAYEQASGAVAVAVYTGTKYRRL